MPEVVAKLPKNEANMFDRLGVCQQDVDMIGSTCGGPVAMERVQKTLWASKEKGTCKCL